jgi:glycerol-3-phosphate dehydrogenase subunit B
VALSADVLVIGGGMAGAAAALSARQAGASVLLVARGPGATALSSGAADIAAVEDLPLREAARVLARRSGHPYALIDDLDAMVAEALRLLKTLGYAGGGERNLWLLSPLGCAKPAALAQSAIAAGDLRALPRDARPAVVALAGSQAIEARLQAAGLRRFFEKAFVLPLDFYTQRSDALRTLPEMARDIDERRDELAALLRRAGASHFFLPTLGFSPQPIEAGAPVFEMLSAPPSVPGLRLQRALDKALQAAGVEVRTGIAERSAQGGVQIVRGVACEPVEAGAIVLATGRFIGGGIRSDSRLRETVFDLPAFAGERQAMPALATEELFAQRARGRHAGLAAGVRVSEGLRLSDRIFAAGAVVGGYDQSRDEGGIGAAALLGIAAGRSAAQAAKPRARASA